MPSLRLPLGSRGSRRDQLGYMAGNVGLYSLAIRNILLRVVAMLLCNFYCYNKTRAKYARVGSFSM